MHYDHGKTRIFILFGYYIISDSIMELFYMIGNSKSKHPLVPHRS